MCVRVTERETEKKNEWGDERNRVRKKRERIVHYVVNEWLTLRCGQS